LFSIQQSGLFGMLRDTWFNHGGNMVQFLIHGLILIPTTNDFTFYNLAIFFVISQLLVFFTVRRILWWLFQGKFQSYCNWVSILAVAGFEGLFVPGFLGTFGFSLASLAHLWPVMAFCFGLIGLKRNNFVSYSFAIVLGLIAGNSNLSESVFACLVLSIIYTLRLTKRGLGYTSEFVNGINFHLFSFFTVIGTLGIALAPGLWNRATDQVGLPSTPVEFFTRFLKSFSSFTADLFTHPMVWVVFFLGAIIAHSIELEFDSQMAQRMRLVVIGSVLLWATLILGSTFAYPSWHQSMGLYVLVFPAAFILGLALGKMVNLIQLKTLFVISSLVMVVIFARIGVMGIERSRDWDRNLILNMCALKVDETSQLLGAELVYKPFGLGVEDVNTWEWMRSAYSKWVLNIPKKVDCD
jgi:hypothetical protein